MRLLDSAQGVSAEQTGYSLLITAACTLTQQKLCGPAADTASCRQSCAAVNACPWCTMSLKIQSSFPSYTVHINRKHV